MGSGGGAGWTAIVSVDRVGPASPTSVSVANSAPRASASSAVQAGSDGSVAGSPSPPSAATARSVADSASPPTAAIVCSPDPWSTATPGSAAAAAGSMASIDCWVASALSAGAPLSGDSATNSAATTPPVGPEVTAVVPSYLSGPASGASGSAAWTPAGSASARSDAGPPCPPDSAAGSPGSASGSSVSTSPMAADSVRVAPVAPASAVSDSDLASRPTSSSVAADRMSPVPTAGGADARWARDGLGTHPFPKSARAAFSTIDSRAAACLGRSFGRSEVALATTDSSLG